MGVYDCTYVIICIVVYTPYPFLHRTNFVCDPSGSEQGPDTMKVVSFFKNILLQEFNFSLPKEKKRKKVFARSGKKEEECCGTYYEVRDTY